MYKKYRDFIIFTPNWGKGEKRITIQGQESHILLKPAIKLIYTILGNKSISTFK